MTLAEFEFAIGVAGMGIAVLLVLVGLWDVWRDR